MMVLLNLKKNDMSRIIFKAKRLDNGKWIQGSLITKSDGLKERAYIVDHFSSMSDYSVVEVDPYTVCQFTGLYAEHKTPIYERDVVECTYFDCQGNDTQVKGIVTWQDWGYYLKPIGKDAEKYDKKGYAYLNLPNEEEDTESCIRVIGSKFDKEA